MVLYKPIESINNFAPITTINICKILWLLRLHFAEDKDDGLNTQFDKGINAKLHFLIDQIDY